MRIAIDAMGSDIYPLPDVAGGVLAAEEFGDTILLVGDKHLIRRELAKYRTEHLKIDIVPATEVITMDDKPSIVGKTKPDSSMHVGMNLVKESTADAFVTVGNTGAAHAVAMLHTLRRIPGVKRPALSAIFPFVDGPTIFLDIGANADSKPEWLMQFAIMGQIYAHNALGLPNPRIGLLSNGEEPEKGSQTVRDAANLLSQLPINFIGNVEPKEVLSGGADVVVSDGFTGNILVKTFEASTRYLTKIIRDEIRSNVFSSLGGLLVRPAFGRVRHKTDTSEVGGAPLLGVNGVVIIGHGSSNAYAVKNAVRQARWAVQGKIIETIHQGLLDLHEQGPHVVFQAGGTN